MKLIMSIDGEAVCTIQVFEELVPGIVAALEGEPAAEEHPPARQDRRRHGLLDHADRGALGERLPDRGGRCAPPQGEGYARGSVCRYNPRQQFCVVYGDDLADEPLKISYIGEVVEGELELALAGMRNWLQQGQIVELAIAA